jgi:hypothetical protein
MSVKAGVGLSFAIFRKIFPTKEPTRDLGIVTLLSTRSGRPIQHLDLIDDLKP